MPALFRSRSTVAVVTGIVFFELLVVATAARSVYSSRDARYDEARRNNENLARVLGEALEGTLQVLDFALVEAKTELERELARGGIRDQVLEPHLLRLYSQIPFLDAIRAADPTGRLTHGIGVPPGSAIDVSDRDYFRAARESGEMVVSAPLVSRISGKRSLVFARSIEGPGGGFGGVVWATVPLERFARVLARVKVGPRGAIALRGSDLALVARYPEAETSNRQIGQRAVSPEMKGALDAGQTEGSFAVLSPVTGSETVTAFRKVGGGAFLVVVVAAPEDFLEGWREQATRTWITTAIVCVLLALGGRLLLGSMKKEGEARFRALVEGAPIAITVTREGRVVYANQAFGRALGLPDAAAAVGFPVEGSMALEDGARALARQDRLAKGLPVEPTAEFTLRRPDGTGFRALVTDARVELADGPAVIGFIEDVSERRRAEAERERLIADLTKALGEVKTLSGMLPICAHCKKIRDDHGYWSRIETYIREHSDAEFTHGICPECASRYFDEGRGPDERT